MNGHHHNVRPAADPLQSPPAALPPMLGSHDPRQAYIWAPIGETPRHVRRGIFAAAANDATDTEGEGYSPEPASRALMPPQTPLNNRRRSPERGRSPSKASRSPSKGY